MLVSGHISNFKEFSNFKSIKEFNTNMEMFLFEHKKDFTKGELIALKRLMRYCAKFYGVANAKISTLLKAINEKLNDFGISRSTFERMLRKAKKLGILTIKNTSRKSGGKGHNVYIFNTIDVLKKEKLTHSETPEKPYNSKDQEPKRNGETINLFETSIQDNNNHLNTRKKSYIKFVPKSLQHFQTFFGDKLKDLYSRVWLAPKKLNLDVNQETMQEIGHIAMNQLKNYVIEGRNLTDEQLFATAYTISENQLIQRLENGEIYDLEYEYKHIFKIIEQKEKTLL